MPLELERKFLIKNLPDIYKINPSEILQGYLLTCDNGSEFRVRKKGYKYFQALKIPEGKGRNEIEIEITKKQFDELWPHTEGKRVEKTRYHYPLENNMMAEIDEYKGKNKGLVVVEVEFEDNTAYEQFTPPEWFNNEVTGEEKYKNKNLAV